MVITDFIRNTVTTDVVSSFDTNFTFVGFGDDNTTPTVSDTTLGNETFIEARFNNTIFTNFSRIESFLDVTENNTNFIREIGVFDAISGGTMFLRNLTVAFEKTSSKSAFFTIETFVTTSV